MFCTPLLHILFLSFRSPFQACFHALSDLFDFRSPLFVFPGRLDLPLAYVFSVLLPKGFYRSVPCLAGISPFPVCALFLLSRSAPLSLLLPLLYLTLCFLPASFWRPVSCSPSLHRSSDASLRRSHSLRDLSALQSLSSTPSVARPCTPEISSGAAPGRLVVSPWTDLRKQLALERRRG